MGALQKLFTTYAPDYLKDFGESMPAVHKKVLAAMIACRTPRAGALLCTCTACATPQFVARSCGNRHCPSCQGAKAFAWLDRQLTRALPTHHFMLTFTVPEPLRAFLRSHQSAGYAALFSASSQAIRTLCADARFKLGDQPGFFGVLHTWGRTLQYHPHIHYVVPGGALSSQDRQWHAARPGFFLPVRALSTLFRATFRDAIARAGLLDDIPDTVWASAWNVNCQAVGEAANTLAYLARYVFKVAISDHRILALENDQVRFAYTVSGSQRRRTMTLPVQEFIRRFLQHVLPTGFVKVRHYGFLSPNFHVPIEELNARVAMAQAFAPNTVTAEVVAAPAPQPMRCAHCGGKMKLLRVLRPVQLTLDPNSARAAPAAFSTTCSAAGP
jgi:Putative transposase/Transposase zinc-binding domain